MKADLPANTSLFPDVQNKNAPEAFQGENLLNYNFNNNEQQDISESNIRPMKND